MDSAPEARFDRLTRLAARALNAPIALLSLIDDQRQFFKSQFGLPEALRGKRETPLSHSICKQVVESGRSLSITDIRCDDRVRYLVEVDDTGVQAYLGAPLVASGGEPLGALCAVEAEPRVWSYDDVAILTDLAAAASAEIQLRAVMRQLEDARAALGAKAEMLQAVLASIDDIVIATDADFQVTVYNEAARAAFQRGPMGPDPSAWLREIQLYHEGGAALTRDEIPLVRAAAGERVRPVELEVHVAGQPPRWHSISASPVRDAAGQVIGAVTVGRDVTELRALRARS